MGILLLILLIIGLLIFLFARDSFGSFAESSLTAIFALVTSPFLILVIPIVLLVGVYLLFTHTELLIVLAIVATILFVALMKYAKVDFPEDSYLNESRFKRRHRSAEDYTNKQSTAHTSNSSNSTASGTISDTQAQEPAYINNHFVALNFSRLISETKQTQTEIHTAYNQNLTKAAFLEVRSSIESLVQTLVKLTNLTIIDNETGQLVDSHRINHVNFQHLRSSLLENGVIDQNANSALAYIYKIGNQVAHNNYCPNKKEREYIMTAYDALINNYLELLQNQAARYC